MSSEEIAKAAADLETMNLLRLQLAESRAREQVAAEAYRNLEALYTAAQLVATEAGVALGRGFIHQDLRFAVEAYQKLVRGCEP